MESTGLLHLIKMIYWESNGKLVLGTIIIDNDTTMKKVVSHPFTLPRGKANKGGILPIQKFIPLWFCDPNHRSKCVGSMVFELVSKTKELTKLDALQFKKITNIISNRTLQSITGVSWKICLKIMNIATRAGVRRRNYTK